MGLFKMIQYDERVEVFKASKKTLFIVISLNIAFNGTENSFKFVDFSRFALFHFQNTVQFVSKSR